MSSNPGELQPFTATEVKCASCGKSLSVSMKDGMPQGPEGSKALHSYTGWAIECAACWRKLIKQATKAAAQKAA